MNPVFRWCAYCQTFLGESAPYTDYRVTHGICGTCSEEFERSLSPRPTVAVAEKLFAQLFREVCPTAGACSDFLQQAKEAGLRRSDVLVGILQPALYQIGTLWEQGELSVSEEHVFSEWCKQLLPVLLDDKGAERAQVLLAPYKLNQHTLGIHFVATWLADHQIRCRVLANNLPDAELVQICHAHRPSLLGISVALPDFYAATLSWLQALQPQLPAETGICLGGFAYRADATLTAPWPVCRTLDDLRARLEQVGLWRRPPRVPPSG